MIPGSAIGADRTVWALLCVAERRATRPKEEWGYSTPRHMLISHLLIVNKLLSLSLSLSQAEEEADKKPHS